MIICVYGNTDKRPVIYTLLKMLQPMGDVFFVSTNNQYKRLLENGEDSGYFENILLAVTQYTPEEVIKNFDVKFGDFENVIYDNLIPDSYDMFIYVGGAKCSSEENDMLELLEGEHSTINIGFGKDCIPYSIPLFETMEKIEAFRHLTKVDRKTTAQVAKLLSPALGIPAKDLVKVVNRR